MKFSKLNLKRQTIRPLNHDEMSAVEGGARPRITRTEATCKDNNTAIPVCCAIF